MSVKFALSAAFGLALLAAPAPPAQAQEVGTVGNYALNQLEPSAAGDDFIAVSTAQADGHLVPRVYALFDYAKSPLQLGGEGSAIVSEQAFVRVDASLSLFDRLLIGVDVPVAVVQSGDSPTFSGVTIASPDGPAMGDLRLDVRAKLLGSYRAPASLALASRFYFPTAGEDTLAGEGRPRVMPQALLSGRLGERTSFLYGAELGWMLRGPENPHTIRFGAAVGVSLLDDLLGFEAEMFGAGLVGDETPLTNDAIIIQPGSRASVELLGAARVKVVDGLTFGAGAGPGVSDGIGTPTYRVVGMIGWTPMTPRDRSGEDDDADGVLNGVDRCPTEKGEANDDPAKNGCAPPDRDGDKVVDTVDACPSTKGRPNADPTRNGCPSDYDRDGIADEGDACPNQRGVASVDPARNGCPGDVDSDLDGVADKVDACPNDKGSISSEPSKNGCPTADGDGDGIADKLDACPNERGLPDPIDKTKNGCPKQVRVTTGEIVILRQVTFKSGKSSLDQTVDPVSDDLLTEVRDVILQHPEIERIEVQGHADDTGTGDFNKSLSQQRADAVRRWLVGRGIDAKRLVARGYGSTVPVAENTTDEGRQKNRRVQFVITQKRQ